MQIEELFHKDSLLAVIKPQGIASVPGKLPDLCSIVLQHYPHIATVHGFHATEGGLLNRLDNETGGILLFAESDKAFSYYQKADIQKHYYAVTTRIPAWTETSISYPIAHHYSDNSRMVVLSSQNPSSQYRGKPQAATTHLRYLKTIGSYTLIEAIITKGVRHQIRVHMAAEHIPILGDRLYNRSKKYVCFHQLFCHKVALKSFSGEKLEIQYYPKELENFLPI